MSCVLRLRLVPSLSTSESLDPSPFPPGRLCGRFRVAQLLVLMACLLCLGCAVGFASIARRLFLFVVVRGAGGFFHAASAVSAFVLVLFHLTSSGMTSSRLTIWECTRFLL